MPQEYFRKIEEQHNRLRLFHQLWNDKIVNIEDEYFVKNFVYNFSIYFIFHTENENIFLKQEQDLDHIKNHNEKISTLLKILVDKSQVDQFKANVSKLLDDYFNNHLVKEDKIFDYTSFNGIDKKSSNKNVQDLACAITVFLNKGYLAFYYGYLQTDFYKKYFDICTEKTQDQRDSGIEWYKMVDLREWNYMDPDLGSYISSRTAIDKDEGLKSKYYFTLDDKISKFMIKQHKGDTQYVLDTYEKFFENQELIDLFSSGVYDSIILGDPGFFEKFINEYLESIKDM